MSNHPIFLDVNTLTSQDSAHPFTTHRYAEMTTPRKLQPSALHGSKAAKTLLL